MIRAVVFDVGNVLYGWEPRRLYERLINDDQTLDAFLETVVTHDWHFQHDAGRPFAETSAELIGLFPQHRALIEQWGLRFAETITGPVPGMHALVDSLAAAGMPLFGITNFSAEFWAPFRTTESAFFDRFQGIIVSGVEKLVKPDPAIYRLALHRFGLAPGEALFVDDRLDNVTAAQDNGFIGHHFKDAATLSAALSAYGVTTLKPPGS